MAEPQTPDRTAPAGVDELTCITCGYDLRGQDEGGVCPECGTALRETLRARESPLTDPKWLRATRRGLTTLLVAGALSLMVTVLYFVPLQWLDFTASPITDWGIPLLVVFTIYLHLADASWLLTRPEPGRAKLQPEIMRWVMRIVLLAFVLVGLAHDVDLVTGLIFSDRLIWSISYGYQFWEWTPSVLFIVGAFLLLWRLRRLATVARRPQLAIQLRWLQWLLPLYTLALQGLLEAQLYIEPIASFDWMLPFLLVPQAGLQLWALIVLFLLRRRLGQGRREPPAGSEELTTARGVG